MSLSVTGSGSIEKPAQMSEGVAEANIINNKVAHITRICESGWYRG